MSSTTVEPLSPLALQIVNLREGTAGKTNRGLSARGVGSRAASATDGVIAAAQDVDGHARARPAVGFTGAGVSGQLGLPFVGSGTAGLQQPERLTLASVSFRRTARRGDALDPVGRQRLQAYQRLVASGSELGDPEVVAGAAAMMAVSNAQPVAGGNFGYAKNAGLVRALLSTGPEGSLERYRALGAIQMRFGYAKNRGLVQALLASGREDSLPRFVENEGVSFGYRKNAGLARALVAIGPDGSSERFRDLDPSSVNLGYDQNAGLVRAMLATGPDGSIERFRELGGAQWEKPNSFGYYKNAGLVRAILATGPTGAVERFQELRQEPLRFGKKENAALVCALLACASDEALARFEALSAMSIRFGYEQNEGLVRAILATADEDDPRMAIFLRSQDA